MEEEFWETQDNQDLTRETSSPGRSSFQDVTISTARLI
jgi:hypothetical protein